MYILLWFTLSTFLDLEVEEGETVCSEGETGTWYQVLTLN